MMKLSVLYAESFKLDGGACFGVVPKSIWGKAMHSDPLNRIPITTRLLLIQLQERNILVDTGVGNKQDEKFKQQIELRNENQLLLQLNTLGLTANDITDVILTHLHFDHVGGCTYVAESGIQLQFPNAIHWCSQKQVDWAFTFHSQRERASYLPENLRFLSDTAVFRDIRQWDTPLITFMEVNGHTPGQILPLITYNEKTIVYLADFIPSLAHIRIPYVAAYDIAPLVTMQEKEVFIHEAIQKNYILLFQHDVLNECCTLKQTSKGVHIANVFRLAELSNIN